MRPTDGSSSELAGAMTLGHTTTRQQRRVFRAARPTQRPVQRPALGLVLGLLVPPLVARTVPAQAPPATTHPAGVIPPMASLPAAHVTYDDAHERLTIELPPADVPAAAGGMEAMVMSPIYQAVIPVSCTVYSARGRIVDAAGHPLPLDLLHHFHLSDPDHRDLFLPVALHVLGLSKETPPIAVPRLLLGLPLTAGQRLITWGGLRNPTATPHPGTRIVVDLGCRRSTGLLGSAFPLFRAYPWVIDVMTASGRRAYSFKDFALPPGKFSISIDRSPAIPGTIVGIGGHLHDYGASLELRDVTTGQVLWHVTAQRDAAGHMLDIPITTFYNWHRLGLHITPSHVYRVTATYDNPTGHTLPAAGMGSVAGLFVPDRGTTWPAVDPSNPAYVQDMMETFGIGAPHQPM